MLLHDTGSCPHTLAFCLHELSALFCRSVTIDGSSAECTVLLAELIEH